MTARAPKGPARALAALCALAAACGSPPDEAAPDALLPSETDGAAADFPGAPPGTAYHRTVAFMDAPDGGGGAMFVPWDFRMLVEPDSLRRSIRGWLGRGGEWRLFGEDDWRAPLTRTPWRIVPGSAARLVVGGDGALGEIYFREGVRDLRVRLGEAAAEWDGPRGGVYRLLDGTARLGEMETRGIVLDALVVAPGGPGQSTELALLAGEDGFRMIVTDLEEPGAPRAWALGDFFAEKDSAGLSWTEVEVEWTETRTFERARRDLPVAWSVTARGPDATAEFVAASSHVQTLDEPRDMAPVLAVYEVEGSVFVAGRRVAARGFLRHLQR